MPTGTTSSSDLKGEDDNVESEECTRFHWHLKLTSSPTAPPPSGFTWLCKCPTNLVDNLEGFFQTLSRTYKFS